MKKIVKICFLLSLILVLLLTACGKDDSDEASTTSQKTEKRVMGEQKDSDTGSKEDGGSSDSANETTKASDEAEDVTDSSSEADNEDKEEGEIDVSLLDRALLESIKFTLPDSFMKVEEVVNWEGTTDIVTKYQKGFSTREETLSDGVTEVEIYNAEEGITYNYTLGETTGFIWIDDEDDKASLEEDKDMIGQSIMTIFERDFDEDIVVKASREKMLGMKALKIELIDPEAEEGQGGLVMWFAEKYTIDLRFEMDFGEGNKYVTETTEIEFNLKLDDDLFEAPKGVTFVE